MSVCRTCTRFGQCFCPSSPSQKRLGATRRSHGRSTPGWRPIETAQPAPCKLCGTPFSCEAERYVYTLYEGEFQDPQVRLAVHRFAYGLGWRVGDFYPNLLELHSRLKVHFTDHTRRKFDLDFSAFERDEDDPLEPLSTEMDAVRCWVADNFGRFMWRDTLPELRGRGKDRFKITASILLAAYGELEDELIRLARARNPVE